MARTTETPNPTFPHCTPRTYEERIMRRAAAPSTSWGDPSNETMARTTETPTETDNRSTYRRYFDQVTYCLDMLQRVTDPEHRANLERRMAFAEQRMDQISRGMG